MKRPLHLLHADDDEEDRWIFQDGVNTYDTGIALTQFDDGLYLLEHLETLQQDPETMYAIVCDMQMTFVGGIGVLSQVKAMPAWKEVPFIIFTTSSLKEDIHHCMNKGAMAFYSKPNTLWESQRMIEDMIRCCQKQAGSGAFSVLH